MTRSPMTPARWAAHCAPRSASYWEIWLDGEKIETLPPAGPALVHVPGDDSVEPIYGKVYLPRKFKTAFAFPDDNCTDIHANDLGFLAIVEEGRIAGYNVLVGGGLGTTPKRAEDVSVSGGAALLREPRCRPRNR